MKSQAYDAIVIGSGPAGLTAAIYLVRGAASTLVIGGEVWGGQLMLTSRVDNFPGFSEGIQGPDLMQEMRSQAEKLGAVFLQQDVKAVDLSKKPFTVSTIDNIFLAKTIIIATGAVSLWLDVPGVKNLIGKGVSSCATCDAPFYKDQKIAVVGGGDTACEEANYLTKYAAEVYLIHRRDQLRAEAVMQKKVLGHPKVKILWNTEVMKVRGANRVEGIVIKDNVTGETEELAVDGLFIAIGHKPQSEMFKGQLATDEKGFVKVAGGHSRTSVPGVFAAGDVMDPHYKQAVTAAGSGCAAALDSLAYLEENSRHG